MIINVPQLPPPSSSPNYRGNWAKRYRDAKVFKEAVYLCAVDARNKLESKGGLMSPPAKVKISLTFVYPERRVRDIDNIIASFKPGLDGLVQAGVITGDSSEHIVMGKISIEVDKKRAPLTIIELTEIERLEKGG